MELDQHAGVNATTRRAAMTRPRLSALTESADRLIKEIGVRNRGHSKSNFYTASPLPHACPICGQHGLIRIRRRFIDRILSMFVKLRRYRCTQPGCQWQGNLREKSAHKVSSAANKPVLQQPD